jgi:hypothetical protein
MDYKKLLVLLMVFTLYVNYTNYFEKDRKKLFNQIIYMESKIEKEKQFNKNVSLKQTSSIDKNSSYLSLFYDGEKFSYSQAMGEMQDDIEKSLPKNCKISNIQWRQTASGKEQWYDTLRFNLTLFCKTPNNFISFQNTLKERKKLFNYELLRLSRSKKSRRFRIEEGIKIQAQILGYRVRNNEKK